MSGDVALLIGNSDGIGLETTKRLLDIGYNVTGISRSASTIENSSYNHIVVDVSSDEYREVLSRSLSLRKIDLCIFFVGIGERFDPNNIRFETKVFEVNLLAGVITTELVINDMIKNNHGHFIGLSSIADLAPSQEAPSYNASKSALTNYWEGLALALSKTNVRISNIRFGFVNTKMAKASIRPFMISKVKASKYILSVVDKPRIRGTRPMIMNFLMWLSLIFVRLKLFVYRY
ncbi:MAG: SDR family oxidoreductase [Bacteriovoracaceae bacterium]|jgi:short-subunit dehydrogenase|nr:SDR family oxidoreductase [Bacteriovoracaceae bacterium]